LDRLIKPLHRSGRPARKKAPESGWLRGLLLAKILLS
jgi:hypothetical protein